MKPRTPTSRKTTPRTKAAVRMSMGQAPCCGYRDGRSPHPQPVAGDAFPPRRAPRAARRAPPRPRLPGVGPRDHPLSLPRAGSPRGPEWREAATPPPAPRRRRRACIPSAPPRPPGPCAGALEPGTGRDAARVHPPESPGAARRRPFHASSAPDRLATRYGRAGGTRGHPCRAAGKGRYEWPPTPPKRSPLGPAFRTHRERASRCVGVCVFRAVVQGGVEGFQNTF